ncbi:LysR substrate-binding domain-containing protein [Nannocystis pusilla]|uniref:LysR substrate-binding domain-containing protein n=1 Tax=Nannocystis pusilla TaxID=889268 RepID=UPI003B7DB157
MPGGGRLVRRAVAADSNEALRQLALAGMGLAWLPDVTIAADVKRGALRVLFADTPEAGLPIHLVFPQGRLLAPASAPSSTSWSPPPAPAWPLEHVLRHVLSAISAATAGGCASPSNMSPKTCYALSAPSQARRRVMSSAQTVISITKFHSGPDRPRQSSACRPAWYDRRVA